MKLKKSSVRQIALECGFHLKVQDGGGKDLNPYVYEFADRLAEAVAEDFLVVLRVTYNELDDIMREVDSGSSFRALLALRRLRQSVQEIINEDERAAIFALMDAIGGAFQK